MSLVGLGLGMMMGGMLAGSHVGEGPVSVAVARGPTRPAAPPGHSRYDKLDSFARALALLEREYVLPVDGDALIEAALAGMTARLDPHTAYLPPEEAKMLLEDIDGRFGGVGIVVSLQMPEDGRVVLEISEVLDGGPASAGGVRVGDRIVAIEGRSVAEYVDLFEAVQTMRGPVGSTVRFEVEGAAGEIREIVLERARIQSDPVKVERRSDGVGLITLRDFQDGAASAVRRALEELGAGRRGGVSGVVLDLRDNGGGLLDEAIGIVDIFVSRGVIVRTRGRGGRLVSEVYAAGPRTFRRLPLAVLINKGSASASEIVAAALQDHDRAVIVGERSYGKGSVQSPVRLPNGGLLKLTTALYYSPDDRVIQAMGVSPDVPVDSLDGVMLDSRPGLVTEDEVPRHMDPAALDRDLHSENGLVVPDTSGESGADVENSGDTPSESAATREAERARFDALERRQLEVAVEEVTRRAASGGR